MLFGTKAIDWWVAASFHDIYTRNATLGFLWVSFDSRRLIPSNTLPNYYLQKPIIIIMKKQVSLLKGLFALLAFVFIGLLRD